MTNSSLLYEIPRHRMISARISPMVELARWMFERQGIAYAEEPHAPILHVIFTRLAGGGNEIPVVISAEGIWDGGPDVVRRLNEKSPPRSRVLTETPEIRVEQEAFIDFLFSKLLKQVRRHVYSHLLPLKALLVPVVTEGAPLWERLFVSWLYPLWRRLMVIGLDFTPELLAQAPKDVLAAFAFVESHLSSGQRFIAGDAPGVLDVIFSALSAPVIFPDQYGAQLPRLVDVPVELREFIEALRARRGGQLVLDTYAVARGTPQPLLKFKSAKRSWIPAYVVVLASGWLRRLAPRLSWRKFLIVSRWRDVKTILSNDISFQVASINAPRISEVGGPFILGMDRGTQLLNERRAIYTALNAIDLEQARNTLRTESERLIQAASAGLGRIDVVNGYARLVAARTAVTLFGIAGPTEPDLLRVTRRIFHHTFLNIQNDPRVRDLAIVAGKELSVWISLEMETRRAAKLIRNDFLGSLLDQCGRRGLDEDAIRRSVAGMLVGSIDTTTTTVTNIVVELLANKRLSTLVVADLNETARLTGWCWELLRRRPHNPILLRSSVDGAELAGAAVPNGTTVVAVTVGAMHDPAAFPQPRLSDPTRPPDRYLHFGAGIHACAGRLVNDFQIPELVGALVRAKISSAHSLRFDGPFPDQFVVGLAARTR